MPSSLSSAEIGFGTATFGRETDAATAHRLLDHAYTRGVRHFDTAAAYSAGAAEHILGEWLRTRPEVRDTVTVATKILPPYSGASIEAAAAASIGRIGLEFVDLLYLHRWDPTSAQPEVRAALDALVRSGRVRSLGISNCPQVELETAISLQRGEGRHQYRWLQNNHNFAVRDASASLQDFCAANGLNLVTFSPLGAGFLTGKHAAGVVPGSRFAVAPAHADIYFNPVCQRRLGVLTTVAKAHDIPVPTLALAWAFRQPGTRLVLIGGRHPSQIDQSFEAQDPRYATAVAELSRLEPDS
jgi:aryl-alcohol dehydrogenase-like predicted oxidoreductase